MKSILICKYTYFFGNANDIIKLLYIYNNFYAKSTLNRF